MAKWWYL